jgi:DUF1680 family protein
MRKLVISSFIVLLSIVISGQAVKKLLVPADNISERMFSGRPGSSKIAGYLGDKMNLVIDRRIMAQDEDYLVEPFRHKDETRLWQTEFWGKWIQSAVAAYEYNNDPKLLIIIRNAAGDLIATQMPSGYIGNYSDQSQLQQWDIWGRKYTILGLLACYDLTGDKQDLAAAAKVADHLLSQVGPGKVNIVKTGNYRGMPSCSILEPMVYLYRKTGDRKYLDFSKYIVEQWETADGPKLISKALAGIPVSERFAFPAEWWSYENGQKAYEMMSCYDGLLELYRVTGEPSYLKAVEMAVRSIIDREINVAGSGSAFECFYDGARYQTEPTYHTMETCVTMTWMKLCFSLLRVTGDPLYADQIEVSLYNALLASLKDDGSQIAKYSPLGGIRHAGEEQCGMHINCCNANGPRAFMMIPRFATMRSDSTIFINLYGENRSIIELNKKNRVSIDQNSGYPSDDRVEININPERAEKFSVAFRIPSWSISSSLSVNGIEVPGVKAGSYHNLTRVWKRGDKVVLKLDLSGRLIKINGNQAIIRGPVVLARDTRFNDGFIYESAVIASKEGRVDLIPSKLKPDGIWMAFTAPLVLGTDLEGEFRNPKQVNFCDFASAGNTWGEDSRYKVWIPVTLNVMKADYKSY